MEMQFDKTTISYMEKVAGGIKKQEQTLEVRVSDGMPDIGRVLGAWGQVIVRGKEWGNDQMTVSCGVTAQVLYIPEDGGSVCSVDVWLPFAMKWELANGSHDGKIMLSCLLDSLDARSTSARKLMVRATVSALAEAWAEGKTVELTFYKAQNGSSNIIGVLKCHKDGAFTLVCDDEEKVFPDGDVAGARLYFEF